MSSFVERSAVRAHGRRARQAVRGDQRTRAESMLCANLRSLLVLDAPCVGVFVAHDGEPDLMPLVGELWAHGQTVALPVLNADPADFSMRFVRWAPDDVLVAGRYGIPVPPRHDVPDDEIVPDTLLVSLTGFDQRGNRIGRGAGFFDRYLASFDRDVVGVGFEVQRFDALPVERHDVPLPVVATDLGIRFVA